MGKRRDHDQTEVDPRAALREERAARKGYHALVKLAGTPAPGGLLQARARKTSSPVLVTPHAPPAYRRRPSATQVACARPPSPAALRWWHLAVGAAAVAMALLLTAKA